MAVEVFDRGYESRSHANWGGILAGTAVALGVWLMLYVGGLALGLTALDPTEADSLKGAGIGTGIWALVAPLIALFVGGFVASRLGGFFTRGHAALHGTVVWALTTITGFMLLASLVSSLVGGVFNLGGKAVSGVATAAGTGLAAGAAGAAQADGGTLQSLGLNTNDMVAPINRRLEAQGKPTITADQLEASAKDVLATSVREGRFDRDLMTSSIAENTRLDRQDAEELAGQVEQKFNEQYGAARQKAGEVAESAKAGALKAADVTGKGMLGVFGLMLLGLLSSILGSIVGAPRDHADHGHRVIAEPHATDTGAFGSAGYARTAPPVGGEIPPTGRNLQ